MNPSNPTVNELNQVEQLFFSHMKTLSRQAAYPDLSSFALQCSDRWF